MVSLKSYLLLFGMYLLDGTISQESPRFPPGPPSSQPPQSQSKVARYCQSDFKCSTNCGTSFQEASSSCSCHPACILFGDCCYDYQRYIRICPPNTGADEAFVNTLLKYEGNFSCVFDAISMTRYWMISNCPKNWNGHNHCNVAEDMSNPTVGRLDRGISSIPVVSIDGITFRNIYCALCHGISPYQLVPWSFKAGGCVNEDVLNSTLTIRQKLRLLIKNCDTVLFRPARHRLNYSLSAIPCHKSESDVIDKCESTTVDESILENCSAIAAPIVVDGTQFKNIFCLECYYSNQENNRVELVIQNSCERFGPSASPPGKKGPPAPRPPFPFVPISITFNFAGKHQGASVSNAGDNIEMISAFCNLGEVYDPLESKCVRLTCGDGYFSNGNPCSALPTTDLNKTNSSCERFALDIKFGTVVSFVPMACPSYVDSAIRCLPQTISLAIETDKFSKNISCDAFGNNSHIIFQAFTRSADTIFKLLSPTDVETPTNFQPIICNSFEFVEMIASCYSFYLNATPSCPSEWLNYSHWHPKENSSGESFVANLADNISVSTTKIRHNFEYNKSKGSLVTKEISVLRCNFPSTAILSCPLILLSLSLFRLEESSSDILVYSKNDSIKFTPDMYTILQNGSIQVCNFSQSAGNVMYPFFATYSIIETILSTIGISLSIIGVSFTLVTYCAFFKLRNNLVNMLIMTLCACLLSAQIILFFSGVAAGNPLLCAILAGLGHFFWLSVFISSSLLGLTLKQTFSSHNQAVLVTKPSGKSLIYSLFICFGVPSVVSGTLLLVYLIDGDSFGIIYGSVGGCWIGGSTVNLLAFGLPIAICLVINVFSFLHVTVSIYKQSRSSGHLRKSSQRSYHREFLIYVKIFMILGLTWITGFAAAFTNIQLLWYIFTILTSMQGVFIFFAFTFKSKIWGMWGQRLGLIDSYPSSSTEQSRVTRSQHGKQPREEATINEVHQTETAF